MFQLQHWSRNLNCLWPGNADNTDPSASRRRRNGDNRVINVHGPIVAVKLGEQQSGQV
jgi:hypothetical protein